MHFDSQVPLAIHTLLLIARATPERPATSTMIAAETGANPVIIRNLFSKLKTAELIEVFYGKSGAKLLKSPEKISLSDIHKAIHGEEMLQLYRRRKFLLENNPSAAAIHRAMERHFGEIFTSTFQKMNEVTLADLLNETNLSNQIF